MKKLTLLFTIIVATSTLFAQQRGFKPIKVPNATNDTLYKYSYALIIGESEYTNGWQRLNGVKQDVPEVKRALEAQGFYVVVKENVKSADFDQTVKAFIAKYGQNIDSRVLIYYAGHGHTIKNQLTGTSMGYVVPVDAPNPYTDKTGFFIKAISMNRFEEYAYTMQAKHVLFVFDTSFAGTIFSRCKCESFGYFNKAVRQFIVSGSANEAVPDKSIFRELFVRALSSDIADANKDGYLTGTELGKFLQDNVVNYSRNTQHPQYGRIRNSHFDKGDFVFVLNNN